VGGALIKGISGGERKRTSVGVELVVKPALVFLDEPTSGTSTKNKHLLFRPLCSLHIMSVLFVTKGLDSFSAVQLCQVLKKVANAGASVLFTIHQPASEIFNTFDHVILMNKGRVMYQGAVTEVPSYFGERGHPNPPNYNPADWIMVRDMFIWTRCMWMASDEFVVMCCHLCTRMLLNRFRSGSLTRLGFSQKTSVTSANLFSLAKERTRWVLLSLDDAPQLIRTIHPLDG
jgi:hypothetical protein